MNRKSNTAKGMFLTVAAMLLAAGASMITAGAQTLKGVIAGSSKPAEPVVNPIDTIDPSAGNATERTPLMLSTSAAPEKTWMEQLKNPTPWFSWGADVRFRWELLPNAYLTRNDPPGHERNYLRFRERVWGTLTPAENFSLNARITYEPREYFTPESVQGFDPSEAIIDALNVQYKIPTARTTITVGRQDMTFGNGWLVIDGTPLDGSRTRYFDAARITLDAKDIQTIVDGVFIYQSAYNDAWLPPTPDDDQHKKALIEQDETGLILYATNKSVQKLQADGFFLYKHANKVTASGFDGDVYTPGARFVWDPTQNWNLRAEAAYEFGQKNDADLRAWGFNSRSTCNVRDTMNNQFWIGYEALSGDDPGTDDNEQFDPMWGRWPQWSDLYAYTIGSETHPSELTNLQRINLGWQIVPAKNLTLQFNYHALFAMENTKRGVAGYSSDGKYRGSLLSAKATYKFNSHLDGNVVLDYLFPGDYYEATSNGPLSSREDPAAYFRIELSYSF